MVTTSIGKSSTKATNNNVDSLRAGESMRNIPWARHAASQLKLLVPGAALTYYLKTVQEFWWVLGGEMGTWAFLAACFGFVLGLFTVGLFLLVLFLPKITGEVPNFRTWRDSTTLSTIIPILTASIVVGWLTLVATLGQWSSLGYTQSTVGVTAIYALTLGMLGLIPVPKPSTRKAKD